MQSFLNWGEAQDDGRAPKDAIEEEILDPRDVASCFNLFLGRMPTSSSVGGLSMKSLSTLLRDIFETDEFKTIILQSVLLREELPQSKLENSPPPRLLDWSQRRLPISAPTRRAVGAARTWPQLLELLLADARLISFAPHLAAAEIDRVLRQRLENEAWSKVQRSVVGAIDAASGFEIRGWAVDLCDKSIPVILEFYADNLFIGSV